MPSSAPVLGRRQLLLPALLLAHAGLLLIAGHERPAAALPAPMAITVAEIAAPVLPAAPVEVRLMPVAATLTAPEITLAAASNTPAGPGCALSDAVQTSLRGPEVARALRLIPRAARTSADAMMLWDGRWIDAATIGGGAALEPIRSAVAAAIRAAPADCRDAPVTGPRLLIVADATGSRVLAFGSGRWAWSQVLGG